MRKSAAVAIIVGPAHEALFIRRAIREGDPWSGDIAFPGGRASAEDTSLRATAERETREEIGLDLARATYIGAMECLLSPLRQPDGVFGIFPFVYQIEAWPEFALEPSEVAEIVPISLPKLFAGEGRGLFEYRGWGVVRELPCVRLDGIFLWGLTLRMVDVLAERSQG